MSARRPLDCTWWTYTAREVTPSRGTHDVRLLPIMNSFCDGLITLLRQTHNLSARDAIGQ